MKTIFLSIKNIIIIGKIIKIIFRIILINFQNKINHVNKDKLLQKLRLITFKIQKILKD